MEKIVIMMSTYNGELYIEEQLKSLLKQKKDGFDIYFRFRDDGSNDNTVEIIKRFCEKNNNAHWYRGNNMKTAKSFWELMMMQNDFDYYAFCDQDDVWQPEKIKNAIEKIAKVKDKPAIYFSAVNLVDKELNFIEKKKYNMKLSFENSFVQNPAIGCTLVFNKMMKLKLDKIKISGEIGMHDSLIYRIAQTINAEIIYDENSYIKYRQHENNVLGIKTNKKIKDYLKYFIKKDKKQYLSNIAELIYETYYDEIENPYKLKLLKQFIELKNNKLITKLKIVFNNQFNVDSVKQNVKFRYEILFNRR